MFLFTFYACFVMIGTSALSNIGYIVYFNVYGISLNSIEVIGTVGTLTHLITQIAIGYWSDILVFSKYGRRKPLIIVGYIGQVVCVFFLIFVELFIHRNHSQGLVVWYLLFQVMYSIFDACIFTPFSVWLIESSRSSYDFMLINTVSIPIGATIGTLISLLLQLHGRYQLIFWLYAVGGLTSTLSLCYFVPSKPLSNSVPLQKPYVPSFHTCIYLKEFRLIFAVVVTLTVSGNISLSALLNFFTCSFFEASKVQSTNTGPTSFLWIMTFWVPIISSVFSALSNFVLTYLTTLKYDKIVIFKVFCRLSALWMLLHLLGTINGSNASLVVFLLMTAGESLFISALSTLTSIFLRDLITADNLLYGFNRESMYFTAMNVPSQLLSSFLGNLPYILSFYTGYSSGANKDITCTNSLLWQQRGYIVIAAFLFIPIIFLIDKYPLNTKVADQLNVAEQKRGQKLLDSNDDSITSKEKNTDSNNIISLNLQHLSKAEIHDIKNKFIKFEVTFGRCLICAALAWTAFGALFAGIVYQVGQPSSRSSQLLSNLLSIVLVFAFYESFRSFALLNILKEPISTITDECKLLFQTMNNMHEDLRIIIDKYCNSSKVETHSVNIIENEEFYKSTYHLFDYEYSRATIYYITLFVVMILIIVLGVKSSS